MILEKTVELLKQIYRFHKIPTPRIFEVVIGPKYTGVEVATLSFGMFLGLSYTMPSVLKATNYDVKEFSKEAKKTSINKLLEWSYGPLSLEKLVGIATLNGMSQHILKFKNPYRIVEGDIIDTLVKNEELNKESKVTFIGMMKPIIRRIHEITNSITIIEDYKEIPEQFNNFLVKRDINLLKEEEIPTDILFCTGTSLINNSLEGILSKFKRKARRIIVLGPSASMLPDILFDYGVDIIGGMRIKDVDASIKVLENGGGTKKLKQFAKKYNLMKE